MLTELVDRLLELSPQLEDVGGHKYLVSDKGAMLIKPPKIETKNFFSLTQLIGWLQACNLVHKASGATDVGEVLINPTSWDAVEVFQLEPNEVGEYEYLARSSFKGLFELFPDGKELDQEEFMIKSQACFVQTEDLKELIKLVGKMNRGRMTEGHDDGVSQQVTMKAGVHLSSSAVVKNPWMLRPYKTFPEVPLVDVPYFLRLHQSGEEVPEVSLHECDGGQWKVALAKNLRKWLQDQVIEHDLKHVTVL